jgi:mycoredoxin-dependent peroxiredoxin
LLSLSEQIDEFKKADTQLIGIFCQKAEPVKEWAEENKIPFPLLIDEQRETAKDYGVYVRLSYDAFNIARPGNFLVDKTGTIKFVYVSSHQWDRCNTDKLVAEAKAIE